jgi:hypothetical protein
MVWSWGLYVRFAGCSILFPHINDDARSKSHQICEYIIANGLYSHRVPCVWLTLPVFMITCFTCLKLSNSKEVGVFISFRLPNRFNYYILTYPFPPIRINIKFIIINKLEFAPYR